MGKQKNASLSFSDKSVGGEFPVLSGTVGPQAVDIRSMLATTGKVTYDPGFLSTASCRSSITYIDGDKGILLYRGYPIEQLAAQCDFLEVCYLLLFGDLPSTEQKLTFDTKVIRHTMVHDQINNFFHGFRRDAHPMAVMVGTVGALSAFYHDSLDLDNPSHREISAYRLIAKTPTLAAMAYKFTIGQPFVYPSNSLSYSANFMRMLFGVPAEEYKVNPVLVRALDRIFILHADHEQNASTSTVRLAGSSGANPFACIAAGIASLWGPAHGGANEAVIRMLDEINNPSEISKYVKRAKDKNDNYRLMGFGHRIYKNHDPRATIIRQACNDLLDNLETINQPMFEIAKELERIALEDEYFIERNLYPNVDFYSGIILKALNMPLNMFTVVFAMARTAGWISQWEEMMTDQEQRIGRPRQIYTGHEKRDYIGMSQRG